MKSSWVEIDYSRLDSNIKAAREKLNPGVEIIFVIKADAYGHGARGIAQRALENGVKWFAVAYVHEAIELRTVIPRDEAAILVLGVVEPDDVPLLIGERIIPIVADLEHGVALAEAAKACNQSISVHVKVDTGMGRLGIPWEQGEEQLLALANEPGLNVIGVCSHFAKVEPNDAKSAESQAERFLQITAAVEEKLSRKLFRHVSSSRALAFYKEWDLDAVRPGIMLFGYGTGDPSMRLHTNPILEWKTYVAQVKSVPSGFAVGYYSTHRTYRPTDIAVLCVGYADGYLRALSNKGSVLINGRRCPVIGRVSMNWLTVDLGPNSGVKRGDEAILIGRQGDEQIWADELARICRTIAYEILTAIDGRLERRYVD